MAGDRGPVKAVVHLTGRKLIKGYFRDRNGLLQGAQSPNTAILPSPLELQLMAGEIISVDLDKAKAIFFVKAFEGQPEYKELTFFKGRPEMEGLWVRLRFSDNEIVEGLVHNSLNFVNNSGFFLKPTDPQSNNSLVYALKQSLASFEVLGLRTEY